MPILSHDETSYMRHLSMLRLRDIIAMHLDHIFFATSDVILTFQKVT